MRGDLIRFRRSTASVAASSNPVLAAGEPGYETDTHVFKVGDGATAWSSLPAVGGSTDTSAGSLWVPPGALTVFSGSIVEASSGSLRGWSMPAGVISNLVGSVLLPASWTKVTVTAYWLNPTTATGTVSWRFDRDHKAAGEGTVLGTGSVATVTAPAQNTLAATVVLPAWVGVEPGLPMWFKLSRFTGDTLAGEVHLEGLRFDKA